MTRDFANLALDMTFAALEQPDNTRWFADELGYERCEFLKAEGDHIIVRWKEHDIPIEPRNLFCNPVDARICHETLASNAEARVYEPGKELE